MFKNSYKFLISKVTNKKFIILLSIILIGAFLRLYNFEELLRFNNDQVRDIQIVEQIKNGEAIFLGPKAGGTKFNLGPAFYYLEYLSGLIFGFSPAGIALFIPLLSIFSLYLFYLLFKKIFTPNITLALTFLYAISFYAIKYSHFAWNPNVIPFFIFSFLLLILKIKEEPDWKNFSLLGLTLGIAIQLHTTLLVLIPILTFLFLGYLYLKNKPVFKWSKVSLLLAIIFIFNIPFIYGDWINNWDNAKEFISGIGTKTGGDSSLGKNTLSTFQFFLQGTSYHLTGIEPQKNWLNISKLLKSKNLSELLLFLSSLAIFTYSIYLLFKNKLKLKNNFPLILLLGYTILTGLIFLPLGNELNIRFFILLQFLPYLLVGLILNFIFKSSLSVKVKIFLVTFLVLFLTASNLNIFYKTYNLDNYSAPESAYGGISWGELKEICLNIKNLSKEKSFKNIYLIKDFEYKNSLKYACQKENINLEFISKSDASQYSTFFDIIKDDSPLPSNNFLKEKISTQRFKLLFFEN